MGNSTEKKAMKLICGGEIVPGEDKTIKMPPENAISIGASSINLYGEMAIDLVPNTYIKDENGKVVARIENKYSSILVDKKLDEKTSLEAVNRFMKEKGLKSINEIVEQSKITNIEEDKQNKVSGYSIGE